MAIQGWIILPDDIDRLDLECLDRGEDVLEFRSLLYEEKQAF